MYNMNTYTKVIVYIFVIYVNSFQEISQNQEPKTLEIYLLSTKQQQRICSLVI